VGTLEDRKAALRREIELAEAERARRVVGATKELERLSSLPDFEELVDGTVAALVVTYGRSRPYVVIAYKTGGNWYLTGDRSPNRIDSEELSVWLTSQGRSLVSASVLAEIEAVTVEVASVSAVDLSALLDLAGARAAGGRTPNSWNPFRNNPYGD
jgi:hypothetical protein